MKRTITLAVTVTAALIAAPAQAATLTNSGGTLTYTAAPGAHNSLEIREVAGRIEIGDNSSDDAIDPAAVTASGCSRPVWGFACGGVTAVVVNLGDGDDTGESRSETVPITINGGAGDDQLNGGGPVTLSGGDGDDTFWPSPGATVSGGAGIDRVEYYLSADMARPIDISLDGVANDGMAGDAMDILPDVEDVSGDAGYNGMTLTGSDQGNTLDGSVSGDVLTGGGGHDVLRGNAGDDTFFARDGDADRVVCGPGSDTAMVDQFDQVSDDCETVQVAAAAFQAEDRPPAVTWAGAFAVTASDDLGVAQVQFLDGEHVLCTDTAAPFTCGARLGGGRHTLSAIAFDTSGQTTTTVHVEQVARVKPHLALTVKRRGHRYKLRGNVGAPSENTCSGTVVISAGALRKTTKLSNDCTYSATLTTVRRRPAFSAYYAGNLAIAPGNSKPVRART